jgi:hypothetical protein
VAELLLQGAADRAGLYPEHDLFIQQTKLKNTLRWMMGEEQITHLGVEYYEDDYLPARAETPGARRPERAVAQGCGPWLSGRERRT